MRMHERIWYKAIAIIVAQIITSIPIVVALIVIPVAIIGNPAMDLVIGVLINALTLYVAMVLTKHLLTPHDQSRLQVILPALYLIPGIFVLLYISDVWALAEGVFDAIIAYVLIHVFFTYQMKSGLNEVK